jgi:hypothetical protein
MPRRERIAAAGERRAHAERQTRLTPMSQAWPQITKGK